MIAMDFSFLMPKISAKFQQGYPQQERWAHNALITQSQALATRYRRMQELNSLCVSK